MRLIDADKINPRDVFAGASMLAVDVRNAVGELIKNQPTVDAVEVVHGHWDEMADCSVCGMPAPTDDRIDYINICELNYCPYCGAKMDGCSNEET